MRTERRSITRRSVLASAAAASLVPLGLGRSAAFAAAVPRVVVVGGGFAGATCAKYLKRASPGLDVTLIDKAATHVSCVGSNEVLVGLRALSALKKGHATLTGTYGVRFVQGQVKAVDVAGKAVVLGDGARVPYDRLVAAPGIEFRDDAIPGWTNAIAGTLPHAWQAGAQTTLLAGQLRAMPNLGTVIVTVPPMPYRCPPAPYERASLIAGWLKANKGGGRVVILDANDAMPKQALFQEAWQLLYPGMVQWVRASDGGTVRSVNATTREVVTDSATWRGDVTNVIAPHRAPRFLRQAGLADATGWCPVNAADFASTQRVGSGIHVIGDSCAAPPLPKSGTTGNAQAKVCASAIARELAGLAPGDPIFINTCYSLVAADYGIGLAGVYRLQDGAVVAATFGTSPVGASRDYRRREARDAVGWLKSFLQDSFA